MMEICNLFTLFYGTLDCPLTNIKEITAALALLQRPYCGFSFVNF
jgi:hypothetical protein